MLKGSILVLPYPGNRRGPMDRVRRAALSLTCRISFIPLDPQVQVFPFDIRSHLSWFFYPLLIDFSCPACYVITRNPKNDPVSDHLRADQVKGALKTFGMP